MVVDTLATNVPVPYINQDWIYQSIKLPSVLCPGLYRQTQYNYQLPETEHDDFD